MFKNKKGFTLIELLVVISIIGFLTTAAVVLLNSARVKARDAKRKMDLRTLSQVNELYYNEGGNGNYLGLTGYFSNILFYGLENTSFNAVIPKYINSLPLDPLYSSRDYSYLTKDWSGCANGTTGYVPNAQKFAFYAILERPSAQDLATISDSFDQCNKDGWGFNYRVGN